MSVPVTLTEQRRLPPPTCATAAGRRSCPPSGRHPAGTAAPDPRACPPRRQACHRRPGTRRTRSGGVGRLRCAGQHCLQRSIATALLCRFRGVWPTWCTGVRTQPFAAHAWVEAEDQLIGESYPKGHYRPLLTIGPAPRKHPDH
ncbi:lasso peptide biosynthesis B2 protein [Streptomyces coeruleorubidus]|uniref:lasso peptide biosynthesis B2 protein n=1 Tax=Streptomyces coeruleorubidus TaxID=116188 RepID=UPI0033CBC6CA